MGSWTFTVKLFLHTKYDLIVIQNNTLATSFMSYVDICYLKFELLDVQVRKLSKMLVYFTMKCSKLVLATAMVYSYVYFT